MYTCLFQHEPTLFDPNNFGGLNRIHHEGVPHTESRMCEMEPYKTNQNLLVREDSSAREYRFILTKRLFY